MKLITMILSIFVSVLLSAQVTSQSVSDDLKQAAANLRPYFSNGGGMIPTI